MEARKQIETNVLTYHKNVGPEIVKKKTIVELLRWCHPFDRGRLAYNAVEEGILTKEEAKEFTRIV